MLRPFGVSENSYFCDKGYAGHVSVLFSPQIVFFIKNSTSDRVVPRGIWAAWDFPWSGEKARPGLKLPYEPFLLPHTFYPRESRCQRNLLRGKKVTKSMQS